MDDFVVPERGLVVYLLWQVQVTGLCYIMSGPFVAYLAGRFTRVGMTGLFISVPTANN
jgi:hypothetical protein